MGIEKLVIDDKSRISQSEVDKLVSIGLNRLRYLDTRKFVSSDAISDELRTRLDRILTRYLNKSITTQQYERLTIQNISEYGWRSLLHENRGFDNLVRKRSAQQLIDDARDAIKTEINAFRQNTTALLNGKYSERQIRLSPFRRSSVVRSVQSGDILINQVLEKFHNEGRRFIQSSHPCPDCPLYQTNGWVPISEVVPIGRFCVCQRRCKCKIETRFNPLTAIKQVFDPRNWFKRHRGKLQSTERAFLARHGWVK